MTPESKVTAAVVKYLEQKLGALVLRTNAGHIEYEGRHVNLGRKGTSDQTVCLPNGMFCAVELKAGSNTATPDQEHYLQSVRKRHGIAIVARSPEDVRAALVTELGESVVAGWEMKTREHAQQLRLAPHNRKKDPKVQSSSAWESDDDDFPVIMWRSELI